MSYSPLLLLILCQIVSGLAFWPHVLLTCPHHSWSNSLLSYVQDFPDSFCGVSLTKHNRWFWCAYGFWKPIKSPTGLALIARTHSNRQRNILGQKLVKEAQCSLRLPGCIPEDGWLSTEDRWFRQATWQRFPGAPCPASYRWQMPSVPKVTTAGNRKEAVQSRTFLCKESDTTEWLNWTECVSQQVEVILTLTVCLGQ